MSLFVRNVLIALVITALIAATILYAIDSLNRQRVAELNSIEDQLSIDTLSLDTQFSLLANAPCSTVLEGTELTKELQDLGDRLVYTENQLGTDDAQVIRLKSQYTLLEIRDYLVAKQLAAACGTKPVTVLYFYSNVDGECTECDRASFALSYLRQNYPNLRVYSFDYHLDLGALSTLIALDKVKPEFPAFIIQDKPIYGFTDLETLEKAFPKGALVTPTATSTATTTKK
jgi:hypothetical protein